MRHALVVRGYLFRPFGRGDGDIVGKTFITATTTTSGESSPGGSVKACVPGSNGVRPARGTDT